MTHGNVITICSATACVSYRKTDGRNFEGGPVQEIKQGNPGGAGGGGDGGDGGGAAGGNGGMDRPGSNWGNEPPTCGRGPCSGTVTVGG
ncbi:hypothetical protein C9412_17085 [Stenotrophomonas sp. Nf1]|nr:hypothetical protein C9412_17085 [Stenotrophomonas sp. Nf1]PTA77373.1 hypothetical protein C9416_15860 [Stenotrophomonas sp. Nf4]